MANLLDYLAWRGDLPLSAVPLCDVDALIFARLSYVPFDGIAEARVPLYMAARQVLASVQLSDAPRACGKEDQQLLTQLLQSPRYADILLDGYENIFDPVRQEQFAALTLHLPDGSAAVAFRGTDGTLVGWKEDFNMAFSTVVPAQLDAVRYLSDVAERTAASTCAATARAATWLCTPRPSVRPRCSSASGVCAILTAQASPSR